MVAVVWFRNDLRLSDHLALDAAVKTGQPILPIFIYDNTHPRLLGEASKWWLHHSLAFLKSSLNKINADLIFRQGNAFEVLTYIATRHLYHTSFCIDVMNRMECHKTQKFKVISKNITLSANLLMDHCYLNLIPFKIKKTSLLKYFRLFGDIV